MGTAVRSRRLWGPLQATQGGPTIVYTVPAGRTAVVRALIVCNVNTVVGEARLFLVNGPVANGRVWNKVMGERETVVIHDIVLNPGDELRLTSNTPGGVVTFAGYGSLLLGEPE